MEIAEANLPEPFTDERLEDEAVCAAEYCREFPLTCIHQIGIEYEEIHGDASFFADTLERLDGKSMDNELIRQWIWYSMSEDGFGIDDVKRAIEILPKSCLENEL